MSKENECGRMKKNGRMEREEKEEDKEKRKRKKIIKERQVE